MRQIQVILFDVMETLVTEPFWGALPRFFGTSREDLLSQLHPTSWVDFEKGLISESEYWELFFEDRRPVDAVGVRACLTDAYDWLDGMEAVLAALQSNGCPMHALSNYPVWYELIEQKLRLSRYLEWTFVSCLTGVRKPDPQAYLGAARHLGVAPQDCLFVDDRAVNVDAARRWGWTRS